MSATDNIRAQPKRLAALLAAFYAAGNLGAASAQSAPSTARGVDRLPVPATQNSADIGAIASGYQASAAAGLGSGRPASPLLIMVSFSMPPASLASLADQARRAGGLLVLNGLKDGSLTATAQAVYQTFGKEGAPLQIDPRLFTRYAVSAVPAFILRTTSGDEQSCLTGSCPLNGYTKVSGDVSLDYALEQIATARPAWRPTAYAILHRMGK